MAYIHKLFGAIALGLLTVSLVTLGVGSAQLGSPAQAQDRAPVLVFAAASLSNVLEEVGERYSSQTGNEIVFSFAGSMTLARQISLSAGADLFVSADMESMNYLEERGLIVPLSRISLLRNELVLVAPRDSAVELAIAPGFALAEALGGGRLAVANVFSVPAGRYAKAALNALGVWQTVSNALAEGDDVRAALSFVARGDAPLGIVYATDALVEERVRIVGHFPASSHPPILYPAAVTAEAKPGAEEFFDYLQGEAAGQLFRKAGFALF